MSSVFSGDHDSLKIRILIIDDNSPFVLPLLRSFSGYGDIQVDVLLSTIKRAHHFRYSRYIRKLEKVDSLDDGNIESIIGDVVNRFKSDLIIPTREWLSVLLYRHKPNLEEIVMLHPLPDEATLKITGNKWNLNQWLKNKGFPYTLTSEIGDEWKGDFPILLKPVFGIGGQGIRLIESNTRLLALLNSDKRYDRGFFLQEHIDGYDIDFSFFAVDGKIIYHTMQKGIISGKMVFSKGIEFVKNRVFLEQVSEMIRILNYTGIAHLDFRYCARREQYILIDFNSRYWSSVQGSRAMGINFPVLVAEWVLSQKEEVLDYNTGYYYFSTTALKTIVRNLFSKAKYPVKLRETQLLYIYSDPLPEVMFLLNKIVKVLKR